jgi:hypothetical protein
MFSRGAVSKRASGSTSCSTVRPARPGSSRLRTPSAPYTSRSRIGHRRARHNRARCILRRQAASNVGLGGPSELCRRSPSATAAHPRVETPRARLDRKDAQPCVTPGDPPALRTQPTNAPVHVTHASRDGLSSQVGGLGIGPYCANPHRRPHASHRGQEQPAAHDPRRAHAHTPACSTSVGKIYPAYPRTR